MWRYMRLIMAVYNFLTPCWTWATKKGRVHENTSCWNDRFGVACPPWSRRRTRSESKRLQSRIVWPSLHRFVDFAKNDDLMIDEDTADEVLTSGHPANYQSLCTSALIRRSGMTEAIRLVYHSTKNISRIMNTKIYLMHTCTAGMLNRHH
jgi:hypothetical protein